MCVVVSAVFGNVVAFWTSRYNKGNTWSDILQILYIYIFFSRSATYVCILIIVVVVFRYFYVLLNYCAWVCHNMGLALILLFYFIVLYCGWFRFVVGGYIFVVVVFLFIRLHWMNPFGHFSYWAMSFALHTHRTHHMDVAQCYSDAKTWIHECKMCNAYYVHKHIDKHTNAHSYTHAFTHIHAGASTVCICNCNRPRIFTHTIAYTECILQTHMHGRNGIHWNPVTESRTATKQI